jgi:hypothetical protein
MTYFPSTGTPGKGWEGVQSNYFPWRNQETSCM